MTKLPPSPFLSESVELPPADEPVAAPSISPPFDAAAGSAYVLIERDLLEHILFQLQTKIEPDPPPAFIRAPRHEYLIAVQRGAA